MGALLPYWYTCFLVALCAAQHTRYVDYVAAQRSKTDKLAANGTATAQWVSKDQIATIVEYLKARNVARNNFGLCHGTRSGRENIWFRELWSTMQVWGTELSPVAASTASWTMPWDFHESRPEWLGQADFVYSNAFDHALYPSLALSR